MLMFFETVLTGFNCSTAFCGPPLSAPGDELVAAPIAAEPIDSPPDLQIDEAVPTPPPIPRLVRVNAAIGKS